MKYSKLEFSVGCFMLAGIGALLLLAFKVAGVNVNGQGETYTLYARFDNIGGLKVRSRSRWGAWWWAGWPTSLWTAALRCRW